MVILQEENSDLATDLSSQKAIQKNDNAAQETQKHNNNNMVELFRHFHHHNEEEKPKSERFIDKTDKSGVRTTIYSDTMRVEGVTMEDCMKVICEVEHYPEFLSIYKSVDILVTSNDPVTRDIVQRARYFIHTFFMDVKYVLETRASSDGQTGKKTWTQVEGPSYLLKNSGEWRLQDKGSYIEIYYEFDLQFTIWIPEFFKSWILNQAMHSSMDAVKKRILFVNKRKTSTA
jgi:ribosome-associated toxin RatA of RatAB toxin-antitoxin module